MNDELRTRAAALVADTPSQIWEISQRIAPTQNRGQEIGGSHLKPTSRPPLQIDPLDAVLDEQKQLVYWSTAYGCHRGTVTQRTRWLLDSDIPAWDMENLLERWEPIRNRSKKRWPTGIVESNWLDEFAASKLVERTPRTLRRWRTRNPRLGRNTPRGWEFDRTLLLDMQAVAMQAATRRADVLKEPLVAA